MPHTPDEPFNPKISLEEVVEIFKSALSLEFPQFDARMLTRMEDVGVTVTEVVTALEGCHVVRYEVPPHSRCEIRLEMKGVRGDMQRFVAVVYIGTNHRIFLTDIRDN